MITSVLKRMHYVRIKLMKKLVIILIAICLFGCQNKNVEISKDLNDVFSNQEVFDIRRNNYSEFFDYYAPSDIYEVDGDYTYTCFEYQNSIINMNVNIPSIINNKYYANYKLIDEGYFDYSKLIYSKNDVLVNSDLENIDYFVNLYQIDNYYFFYMKTLDVCLYAKTNITDLVDVAKKILILAKTVKVNRELVINTYSSKDVIDYEKKVIELFDTKMPENGVINDLIIEDSSN